MGDRGCVQTQLPEIVTDRERGIRRDDEDDE